MKYEIIDIKTQVGLKTRQPDNMTRLRVLVHFWLDSQNPATDPAWHIEDFLMDMPKTRNVVKTDAQGNWQKTTGEWIHPSVFFANINDVAGRAGVRFKMETVNIDVRARMRKNIERYIDREEARQGGPRKGDFHDLMNIQVEDTDPVGVRIDADKEIRVRRQRTRP